MDVNLWSCDESARSRLGWDWWWIHLFLEGPRPRHVMTLWSHRAKEARINDVRYKPFAPRKSGGDVVFPTLIGGWSYSGGCVVTHPVKVGSARGFDDGMEYDKGNVFKTEGEGLRFNADCAGERYNVLLSPWNKQQGIMTSCGTKAGYGYGIITAINLKAEGTLESGGTITPALGSAYFQKVTVNVPMSPWYWGVAHGNRGDYVDYFFPYLGSAVLNRRGSLVAASKQKRFPFIRMFGLRHNESKTSAQFGNAKIEVTPDEETPSYTITAKRGREKAKAVFQTLGRARFVVKTSMLFHYNGFPAELVEFEYEKDGERITLSDFGKAQASCEHTWGTII
ncbi:Uncharacterised protein [uncultured archaeon]|nr:Uncharacterised protein [uncultured archaeon]